MAFKIDTDNPFFQRDMHSKALVSNNRKELDEYRLKRKLINDMNSKNEEINTIKAKIEEIDTLKTDIQEIKSLLSRLVNK
jgi:hypothetical protein